MAHMEPVSGVEPTGEAKRRVSYYFDPDVGTYAYTMVHPMKVGLVILIMRCMVKTAPCANIL
jgi:hypothetical protein